MATPQSVPRWTPRPSPSPPRRPALTEKAAFEMHGISHESGDDSPKSDEGSFPFGSSFGPLPPLLHRRTPHQETEVPAEVAIPMAENGSRMGGTAGRGSGRRECGGVRLTWEDLWVSASDGKGDRTAILCGLSGHAQPGEVLAIMGPSGCGKSTLLDTLAGRLGGNVNQTGEILINGRRQKLAFGTSAYVTQDDVLMTTLTVREVVYYSAQLQLPDSMSWSEKKARAEETIQEMGLEGAMDTRIGGWAAKGISGGQKRRVSICAEILTRPQLLFLDEPTSGLDSAASYHVMSRIARLAKMEGMTVVAAIHQPSSEVFELFHGLCLLAYGRTVFFGAASETSEFFASNGFPCPPLRNPSDHFLRTINKDFDKDIEDGPEATTTTTAEAIEILVNSYKSSVNSQRVAQRIAEIREMGGSSVKKGSQASFLTQTLVLTRRSFVNMYRDLGYYWLRFAIYIALCLCVGTIFYNVGYSYGSIQARGSMLMFIAAFLTFMAIGGFPSFVEDMKIFQRERLNGHYGVTAFTIANTLSATPYLALISIVPGAIAYYLVHLQRVEGLMMIVASIVPDFLMGIITGAGIQGMLFLIIVKITEKVKPMMKGMRFKAPEKSVHTMEQPSLNLTLAV
ncbi:ABC transporter G family member 11 [Ananas comosus]|uniref:ABC transporter G family member 11 n=1 Tax=Ananas comosus TaxID=4615 RepID=A0A199VM09_ANACO|nr:ABC transporter G family member 11 [Ananas comosus]